MSIADQLITHGWTQGQREDPATGALCLMGAAERVANGDKLMLAKVNCALYDALQAQGIPYLMAHYNDTPGRTFDEVLRVAKEADAILDQ